MNLDKTYKDFIKDLKQRIYSAKTKAILSANRLMIELYFDIGHEIVNKQDKLGWGKSIVEQMSKDLKNEISDMLASTDKDGFYLKRRFYFMGKWIKHGGYYPTKLLRLFKKDKGRVERDINEQFIVDGNVG